MLRIYRWHLCPQATNFEWNMNRKQLHLKHHPFNNRLLVPISEWDHGFFLMKVPIMFVDHQFKAASTLPQEIFYFDIKAKPPSTWDKLYFDIYMNLRSEHIFIEPINVKKKIWKSTQYKIIQVYCPQNYTEHMLPFYNFIKCLSTADCFNRSCAV